ncbi:hypothetical protein AB1Y20_013532 [Prymnesium parvum]|uniref:RING-type domain-containing protein n=1 Tax=Prymnesium parvum TaxID=97485 RepID=A0AB34IGK6_PRYPA
MFGDFHIHGSAISPLSICRMPAKHRHGARQPPGRWMPAELQVLLECLASESFMQEHAPSFPAGQFPALTVREASVKGSEPYRLCEAIAAEILEREGEHNYNNARPVASIAAKIAAARQENPKLAPKAAFAAFDLESFMNHSSYSGLRGGAASEKHGGGADTDEHADAAGHERGELADGRRAGRRAGGVAAQSDRYVPPVRDGKQLTFQARILNQHLVCTLCMGYFNNACTIIECLHTFCRDCILRHFCESNVCPQCDSDLGTNPKDLVRTDRTLQSIVDKVFPEFSQAEEKAKRPDKRPASPPAEGRPEKSQRQAAPPPDESADDAVSFSLQEEEPSEHGAKLDKPFLRTKSMFTVGHLKKYLSRKMNLKPNVDIDVLCRSTVLGVDLTLERIVKEYWNDADDLILKYRVRTVRSPDAPSGATEAHSS